jgi:integrase
MSKLTALSIRTFRPGAKRREIRDAQAPGLYLIVQAKPSRTMSWALRFRRPDGRGAKLTLGVVDLAAEPSDTPVIGGPLTLAQARMLAAEIARDRARGLDVIEEQKAHNRRQATAGATAAANSFGALVREFFIDHKTKRLVRPRHWHADARLLGLSFPRDADPAHTEPQVLAGSLAATWADKPATTIDRANIITVIDGARRFGIPGLPGKDGVRESRGRKMHACLSNLFAWAVQKGKLASDPTIGVWHPGAPPARERVLTEAEVRLFWRACQQLGAPYGPLFRLLLLTGQRLGEVTGMTYSELSDDLSTWTLPGARTKNHREHQLALAPLAQRVIGGLQRIENHDGLVFTVSGKKLTGFSKAKAELDRIMATLARAEDRDVVAWRLHDLRRTCATGMANMGILPHVVEAVLNHVSGSKGGVAGVYNRAAYADESKAALERWAAHVEGVVSGTPTNVIAIRRTGGAP